MAVFLYIPPLSPFRPWPFSVPCLPSSFSFTYGRYAYTVLQISTTSSHSIDSSRCSSSRDRTYLPSERVHLHLHHVWLSTQCILRESTAATVSIHSCTGLVPSPRTWRHKSRDARRIWRSDAQAAAIGTQSGETWKRTLRRQGTAYQETKAKW